MASSFLSRAKQIACLPGTVYVLAMSNVCVSEGRCKYARGAVYFDTGDGIRVRVERVLFAVGAVYMGARYIFLGARKKCFLGYVLV